jgi:hypothetical protein
VRFALLRRGNEWQRRQTAQVKNFQKHREARSLSDLAGEPNTSNDRPPIEKRRLSEGRDTIDNLFGVWGDEVVATDDDG